MPLYRGAVFCYWIPITRYRRETPHVHSSNAAKNPATQLHKNPTLPQSCLSLHEGKFGQNYQVVVVIVPVCHRFFPASLSHKHGQGSARRPICPRQKQYWYQHAQVITHVISRRLRHEP